MTLDPGRFAVIIPTFNEAGTIRTVVRETLPYCSNIIVVDDGSQDRTLEAIRGEPVHLIHYETNRGKGFALRQGFRAALQQDLDFVITMDGDGQHKPSEIPKIIAAHRATGADLVVGQRLRCIESIRLHRAFGNLCVNFWIQVVTGIPWKDTQCGFRLIGTRLLRTVELRADGYEIETEMILAACRGGFQVASVPIEVHYLDGSATSKMRPLRDTYRVIRVLYRYVWGT